MTSRKSDNWSAQIEMRASYGGAELAKTTKATRHVAVRLLPGARTLLSKLSRAALVLVPKIRENIPLLREATVTADLSYRRGGQVERQ